jgi:hypothetical protein
MTAWTMLVATAPKPNAVTTRTSVRTAEAKFSKRRSISPNALSLPRPCRPRGHQSYLFSGAAEAANGSIAWAPYFSSIWNTLYASIEAIHTTTKVPTMK